MIDKLIPYIFGWPMIILALALASLGVFRKNTLLAILGAILGIPFTLTLLNIASIGPLAIIIPICLFAAAGALVLEVYKWAWIFLIPVVGFLAWAAVTAFA